MFNKIKNFFNRSKKAIDNKCNEIYCKAQIAVANAKAEFYIDKTVGRKNDVHSMDISPIILQEVDIASFPKHRHRVLLSVCLKVPLT